MLMKILDKNYFILFITNILLFYSFMILTLGALDYIEDAKTSAYILIALVAGHQNLKYNIKIKEQKQKSIFYSIFVFIIAIVMHIYIFQLYNINFYDEKNWQFLIMFIIFIIAEIVNYVKNVEYLKNVISGKF